MKFDYAEIRKAFEGVTSHLKKINWKVIAMWTSIPMLCRLEYGTVVSVSDAQNLGGVSIKTSTEIPDNVIVWEFDTSTGRQLAVSLFEFDPVEGY